MVVHAVSWAEPLAGHAGGLHACSVSAGLLCDLQAQRTYDTLACEPPAPGRACVVGSGCVEAHVLRASCSYEIEDGTLTRMSGACKCANAVAFEEVQHAEC